MCWEPKKAEVSATPKVGIFLNGERFSAIPGEFDTLDDAAVAVGAFHDNLHDLRAFNLDEDGDAVGEALETGE